jgi:hypothetical protein
MSWELFGQIVALMVLGSFLLAMALGYGVEHQYDYYEKKRADWKVPGE